MSYLRKRGDIHKLQKLYEKTRNSYGFGAYFDSRKSRLIRYRACIVKGYKRMTKRLLRRQKDLLMNGNSYKKLIDNWIWW